MVELVPTSVGRLCVTDNGRGPATVFWHSLFVDQRSWEPVLEELGPGRRTILIDAPNHGRSESVDHDFTIGDAATQAAHRQAMAAGHDHAHAGHHGAANAVMVMAGEQAELTWTFDHPGVVEFDCNVPGHFEAGMSGQVTVE